jgi:hypothetical protein
MGNMTHNNVMLFIRKVARRFTLCVCVSMLSVFFYASESNAACSNPAGVEGEQIYNTTHKTMQFCDGTNWWSMKAGGGGGGNVELGECQAGEAPTYNADSGKMECPFDHSADAFDFTDSAIGTTSTLVESAIVQITGIDDATEISISGDGSPEYRICADNACASSSAYTSAAGTIDNNDYLQLRLTSHASIGSTNTATITIGDSSDSWGVISRTCGSGGPYTFSYTGADQNFVVPGGCSSITVKLWGAGGGRGATATEKGGAGAFVETTLSVTHGETLVVVVGGGGERGDGVGPYGGGGAGVASGSNGSGGGRSAIRRSSADIVTAGAGGGGGTSDCGNYGGVKALVHRAFPLMTVISSIQPLKGVKLEIAAAPSKPT